MCTCFVGRSYIECPHCRYATSCSESYANHMSVVHAGKSSSLPAVVSSASTSVVGMRLRSTLRPAVLCCACGYTSWFGSIMGMLLCSQSHYWHQTAVIKGAVFRPSQVIWWINVILDRWVISIGWSERFEFLMLWNFSLGDANGVCL